MKFKRPLYYSDGHFFDEETQQYTQPEPLIKNLLLAVPAAVAEYESLRKYKPQPELETASCEPDLAPAAAVPQPEQEATPQAGSENCT